MKQHVITTKLFFPFIILAVLLTACEKDYYEPEQDTKTISDIFGIDFTIPESFNWSTTQSSNITVKVDDQFDGKYYYIIEIYDSNPLFSTDAKLLNKGVAKKEQDFISTIVFPSSTERLVIKQTSPNGNVLIKEVIISQDESQIVVDFNSSQKLTTKSFEYEPVNTYSLKSTTIPDLSKMTQITGQNNNMQNGGQWYIPEGVTYTGSITFDQNNNNKNTTLYVLGKWAPSSDIDLRKSKIVVYNEILAPQNVLKSMESAEIVIEETGSVTVKSTELGTANKLHIYGEFYANNHVKINNGNSKGELFIAESGSFFANSIEIGTQFKIENDGKFTIHTDATFDQQFTIINNCYFLISQNATIKNQSTLTIGEEGKFETGGILKLTDQSKVNLSKYSILKCSTLNLDRNITFEGPSSEGALIDVDLFSTGNYNPNEYTKFNNYLFIKNQVGLQSYILSGDATFGNYNINQTDCNAGGNPLPTPQPVTTPSFPLIVDGDVMTYLFEDNWPSLGDYDLNDLVIDLKPTYEKGNDNRVSALKLNIKLRAVGGTIRLGAAIQLDGINSNTISQVERSDNWLNLGSSIFNISNGIETDQTYAVIPLFNEAHKVMGVDDLVQINTNRSGVVRDVQETNITIKFSSPVSLDAVSIPKFNIFAINKGSAKDSRNEIHMLGYDATDYIHSASKNIGYKSAQGLIWVLGIPGGFKYPLEYTNILNSYEKFKDWATSAGVDEKSWYLSPTSGKVYE